jgi:hypothetical protein
MWHKDVTRVTATRTETWMKPKKQGQNGLQPTGKQKALFYNFSMHPKEVKDNTDWIPQSMFNFAHDAIGKADSIF